MENMQIAPPAYGEVGLLPSNTPYAANDNAGASAAIALTIPGESMVVDDAGVSDSILRAKAKTRRASASAYIPQQARWQRVANALIAGVRERFGFDRED